MTYLERLSPWCIVKLLPDMQRLVVARCRRRNDKGAIAPHATTLSIPFLVPLHSPANKRSRLTHFFSLLSASFFDRTSLNACFFYSL
jgi:hypothetical protein